MNSKSKLTQSLHSWKEKAIERANEVRYLRKENKRLSVQLKEIKRKLKEIKKELDATKEECNQAQKKYEETKKELFELKLKEQNEKEVCKNIVPINNKEELVYIALQLFLIANISFRAVSRVLHVIGGYLGLQKPPCTQTIINWVMRLSIARIQNAGKIIDSQMTDRFSNGYICLIDISIGLGVGKILTVLFLNARHHILNDEAPTLQNVTCVGVSVADTWTGETIAVFLQKIIDTMGMPVAYLKDGGTDLGKSVKILDKQGLGSPSIDDISHVVANLLKCEYENHSMFKTFMSACGKVSKSFKQTILACLAPPKVSTKARFMNIHRLVKWASQLLKHSPKGRTPTGSLLSKLRASFDRLPECKVFISCFLRDANALLECQKILKKNGLNHDTYKQCQQLVEIIPKQSKVYIGFIDWMDLQFSIAVTLGLDKIGMPISSDAIESFFSVAKRHGTGEIQDANQIALRIPAMSGTLTREDAQSVLNIGVKEQQNILNDLPSIIQQRRQVLPNPGYLEKLQSGDKKQNLELVPGPKTGQKMP